MKRVKALKCPHINKFKRWCFALSVEKFPKCKNCFYRQDRRKQKIEEVSQPIIKWEPWLTCPDCGESLTRYLSSALVCDGSHSGDYIESHCGYRIELHQMNKETKDALKQY